MSPRTPTFSSLRTGERLASTPVVRRGARWWLVTPTGSLLASDPTFTGELDRFAANMAAADQAVADVLAEHKSQYEAGR